MDVTVCCADVYCTGVWSVASVDAPLNGVGRLISRFKGFDSPRVPVQLTPRREKYDDTGSCGGSEMPQLLGRESSLRSVRRGSWNEAKAAAAARLVLVNSWHE